MGNERESFSRLSVGTRCWKVVKNTAKFVCLAIAVIAFNILFVSGIQYVMKNTVVRLATATAIIIYLARKYLPRTSSARAETRGSLVPPVAAEERRMQTHTLPILDRPIALPPAPMLPSVRMNDTQPIAAVQQRDRSNFTVSQGCWHIKIDRQKLKDSPDEILNEIAFPCYVRVSSPRQIFVTFKGERGIDYGGPGREFLSLLFKSLSSKSDVLQFVEEVGGFLPRIRHQTVTATDHLQAAILDPKSEGILQTIGALLAFSERMGDYPIGHVFSPLLFDMLVEFSHQDARLPFNALSSDVILKLFKARRGSDTTIQRMYHLCKTTVKKLKEDSTWKLDLFYYVYPDGDFPDYLVTNDAPDLAKLESHFDLFQKSMKEQLYRQALADLVLPCVHAIASGMSRSFGSQRLWGQMLGKGSSTLRDTIQGAISKDVILQKIRCRNHIIDSYIRRWLSRATNVQLENLLQAATGSSRLSVKQTLTFIATRDITRHVAFHTCNGQIDVPLYTKYEVFRQKFNESLTNALASGFTLA